MRSFFDFSRYEHTATNGGHLFVVKGRAFSRDTVFAHAMRGILLSLGITFAALIVGLNSTDAMHLWTALWWAHVLVSFLPTAQSFTVKPGEGILSPSRYVELHTIVKLTVERYSDNTARLVLHTTSSPVPLTPFIAHDSARQIAQHIQRVIRRSNAAPAVNVE